MSAVVPNSGHDGGVVTFRPGEVTYDPGTGQWERVTLPAGWPLARTSDGTIIVPGLKVLDYNWRESVVGTTWHMANGINDTRIPWFDTTGGMFDGSRMKAL